MKPFGELSRQEKAAEVLRWIGVLPAAILASVVAHTVFGLAGRFFLATSGAGFSLTDYFRLAIYYVPKGAAFVMAGAMTAPRCRASTAAVLSVLGIALSFMVHIGGPSHVGTVNYLHLSAESAGAILGATCILYYQQRHGASSKTAS